MDRAAKEAKKRFPDVKREDFEDEDEFFDCLEDRNLRRLMWREGYRQAEQDLALTWEDVNLIDSILIDMQDEGVERYGGLRQYYEETLKRFNEQKKK